MTLRILGVIRPCHFESVAAIAVNVPGCCLWIRAGNKLAVSVNVNTLKYALKKAIQYCKGKLPPLGGSRNVASLSRALGGMPHAFFCFLLFPLLPSGAPLLPPAVASEPPESSGARLHLRRIRCAASFSSRICASGRQTLVIWQAAAGVSNKMLP